MQGKLYLIPTPLGEESIEVLPQNVIDCIHSLRHFIVEKGKTARHFIKKTNPPYALQDLLMVELNEHTQLNEYQDFLRFALEGKDIGLMSEAGCPGVADPGAVIVEMAHQKGIEVMPLVGPSSILLALMGSGMNGQSFAFNGYLSAKSEKQSQDLKQLEQKALKYRQTQIFIETPYRNHQMIENALKSLQPQTKFCIAADLTLTTQFIKTLTIQQWKKTALPDLKKRPAIFLIG